MAEPSAGKRLSLPLYGRDPLQGQGGSQLRDEGGLCGPWHHHGWPQGHSRCGLGSMKAANFG